MRINKNDYLKIIRAGIKNGELSFIQRMIGKWLEKYPGDLVSRYYSAELKNLQGDISDCKTILRDIILHDPENLPANRLFSLVCDKDERKTITSNTHVLTGEIGNMDDIFPWAVTLRAVRNSRKKGNLDSAKKLLMGLSGFESDQVLIGLESLRIALNRGDIYSFQQKAKMYLDHWAECIQIRLFDVQALLLNGNEHQAISQLHTCVSLDPGGEIVKREWGSEHEFSMLWPDPLFIDFNVPMPPSIAVPLGWKRLRAGESLSNKGIGKTDTRRIKQNETYVWRMDENSTKASNAYVILATRSGLESKYGAMTTDVIVKKLQELQGTLNKREKWEALIFLPDDSRMMKSHGLKKIDTVDPWKIKLALGDLNKELLKKNKQIKVVLIIGGQEIVPFHGLSNPTDDSDSQVLSDNPYGTTTGNYLLPEWTVGRLPDEKGSDPGLLLAQIRQINQYHKSINYQSKPFSELFRKILKKLQLRRIVIQIFNSPKNFGYSTAVWRRSSLAAFRPIGKGADLRITPPFDKDTIDVETLMKAKCAYINLHGLSNTPEWYGQRDFSEEPNGPDFPVAIHTKAIPNVSNNIDMVFTEACYGGYVVDKSIDESMALKLIAVGSQGFVGSTCISYGSVFTPLIGADLLAFIFWKYLRDGYSFGESLLQAKIGLVKVMNQRQGYLDGEDQKTLMSFVLYGDPLAYLEPNTGVDVLTKAYDSESIEYTTISDQEGIIRSNQEFRTNIPKEVNEIVQSYIPSLENANIRIREYKVGIDKLIKNHQEDHPLSNGIKRYTQIQYGQKSHIAKTTHEHFVRVTIDDQGKVTKLAVSR